MLHPILYSSPLPSFSSSSYITNHFFLLQPLPFSISSSFFGDIPTTLHTTHHKKWRSKIHSFLHDFRFFFFNFSLPLVFFKCFWGGRTANICCKIIQIFVYVHRVHKQSLTSLQVSNSHPTSCVVLTWVLECNRRIRASKFKSDKWRWGKDHIMSLRRLKYDNYVFFLFLLSHNCRYKFYCDICISQT